MKKVLIQVHIAILLLSFTGVFGRAISIDAIQLVWYRVLLTALFFVPILYYRNEWVRITSQDLVRLSLIGGLMGLHWIAFYGSVKLANASIAVICLSTGSIFTTMIHSLLHRQLPDKKELIIGVVSALGVFVIYVGPQLEYFLGSHGYEVQNSTRNWGILAGVVASILCSWFTVLNKRVADKYPARTMVFYEMVAAFLVVSLLLPLSVDMPAKRSFLPGWIDLLLLVVLSLCCTVWALSLQLNALKYLSSFTTILSLNMEPLYGILLAFILFKENTELGQSFYLGLFLILFSVVMQTLRVLKPPKLVLYLDKYRLKANR